MAANLYRSRSTINTLYYPTSATRTEIDLRQEIINTLDGSNPEIAKAQLGLIRKMKRNSDGNFIPCSCVDEITKEATRDRLCPFCLSVGKIWSEELVKYYTVPVGSIAGDATLNYQSSAGLINVPLVLFYVRYSADITRFDQLVELQRDEEGEPAEPYQRSVVWVFERIKDYRSDNGRIEYWQIWAREDKVKWLNVPSYSELI